MECMHAHKGGIAVVRFSPNCQRMLTAGTDSHVVVWDVATRKQLHTFQEHESECLGKSPVPDCSHAQLQQNCRPASRLHCVPHSTQHTLFVWQTPLACLPKLLLRPGSADSCEGTAGCSCGPSTCRVHSE